jgi:hypothetical protein
VRATVRPGSVLLSLCYLLLRRVLPPALCRWRSNDVKALEVVVLRHELAILRRQTKRPAMNHGRPAVLCGGEPVLAAEGLAILRRDAGNIAAMASTVGGETVGPIHTQLDAHRCAVRFETWCFGWLERTPGGDINGCRRAEGSWRDDLTDDGSYLAAGRRARTLPADGKE